jgi:hypothetical protein
MLSIGRRIKAFGKLLLKRVARKDKSVEASASAESLSLPQPPRPMTSTESSLLQLSSAFTSVESLSLPRPLRPLANYNEFLPAQEPYTASFDVNATVKPSVLCALCRPIRSWLQANWFSSSQQSFDHFDTGHRWNESFDHYDTGRQLEESFLNGCHLCTFIWHSFDPMVPGIKEILVNKKHLNIRAFTVYLIRISQRLVSYFGSPEGESIQHGILDLWTCSGSASLREPGLFPSPISTSSSHSQRLSETWIRECTTSHAKCRQGKTSTLPGRILDVSLDGENDQVRVVDTNNLSGDINYAALSYCWGRHHKSS